MWSRQTTIAPITSLLITTDAIDHQRLIHAGSGPTLLTYNLTTGHLLAHTEVLPSSVVHGIRAATPYNKHATHIDQLLTFGQKSLAMVTYDNRTSSFQPSLLFSLPCTDLISDAKTLRMDTSTTAGDVASTSDSLNIDPAVHYLLAIGFAHNNVELWTCDGNGGLQRIHRVESHVRCLLYSMTLFGNTLSELVVGSGTIFNQIVLWDPLGDGSPGQYVRGHHGVLFSVQFSTDGTHLCSTSDDRTVRMWKRNGLPNSKNDTLTCQYQSSWTAFGHTARVWDCVFLPSLGRGCVASVAEDGTCRIWGNPGTSLAVLKGHGLKNVWSCAIDATGHVLVTGGGDSAIKLWDVGKYTKQRLLVEEGERKQTTVTAVAATSSTVPNPTPNKWIRFPRTMGRINAIIGNHDGSVAFVATANGIMACDVMNRTNTPTAVYGPSRPSGPVESNRKLPWCTLSLSRDEQYIVAGNAKGDCHVVSVSGNSNSNNTPLVVWQAHEFRCWKVQWSNGRQPAEQQRQDVASDKKVGLLLTFGAEGSLKVWDIQEYLKTGRTAKDQTNVKPTLCCWASISQLQHFKPTRLNAAQEEEQQQKQQLPQQQPQKQPQQPQQQQHGRKKKRAKTKQHFSATFSCGYYQNDLLFAGDNRGGISVWSPNGAQPATLLWYEKAAHGHDKVHWFGQAPATCATESTSCDDIYYSVGHDGRLIQHLVEHLVEHSNNHDNHDNHNSHNNHNNHNNHGEPSSSSSTSFSSTTSSLTTALPTLSGPRLCRLRMTQKYKCGAIAAVESVSWTVDQHMIVVGFLANSLIVHDLTAQYELVRVACGGWRRPYDIHLSGMPRHAHLGSTSLLYVPTPGSRATTMAALNSKDDKRDVVLEIHAVPNEPTSGPQCTTNLFHQTSLHTNYHGRLSTAVRWIPSRCKASTSSAFRFIVTGGEDNAVKLLRYDSTNQTITCIDSSQVHTSAVFALDVLPVQKHHGSTPSTHLLFSAGGNNMLSWWTIDTSNPRNARLQLIGSHKQTSVVLNTKEKEDDDCRYMSMVAMTCGASNKQHGQETPPSSLFQSRNDTTSPVSQTSIVLCGSSQGTVSLFRCDVSKEQTIEHLHTFHLPGMARKPLLSIATISHHGVHLAVTGSTDGTIAVWDVSWAVQGAAGPSMMAPIAVLQWHNMGVNAIAAHAILGKENTGKHVIRFCVATGGDDNALSCGKVSYDVATKALNVLSRSSVGNGAASAIKSVWTNGNVVVATGWDQRLSVWAIDFLHGALLHRASTFVHVADCAALDLMEVAESTDGVVSMDVVVVGQGLEVNRLTL